jgi:meso-butanediol dehydrogenase / (S,S)-butanediol dehydrogenase / diacetyl reductase
VVAGKVVFITGTGRGQGRAAALAFSAAGALVVGGDIDAAAARETTRLAEAAGGGPVLDAGPLDVTDEDSVRRWIRAGSQDHGRIDVLYNNAGAVRWGAVGEQPYADWAFTLRSELDSVFLTTSYAWPLLQRRGGCVINVASTAGMRGSVTNRRAAHSASKAGVIGVTRQLAAEDAAYGIRVNAISPGMIDTEGAQDLLADPDHPMHRIAASVPLGRLGTPEDVVNVALFLASDRAGYITGANIVVDGGWSAVLPGPAASPFPAPALPDAASLPGATPVPDTEEEPGR